MLFSKSVASKFGVLLIAASITTVSSLLASSVTEVSLAQQATTKPILSTQCIRVSGQGTRGSKEDISINRELFTSNFFMGGSSWEINTPQSFTCKINSANSTSKFKSLRLEFGLPDEATKQPTTVNVYLNGNPAVTKTVSAGEKQTVFVDASKARSIAIEVVSTGEDKAYGIYFIDASLSKNPVPKTP